MIFKSFTFKKIKKNIPLKKSTIDVSSIQLLKYFVQFAIDWKKTENLQNKIRNWYNIFSEKWKYWMKVYYTIISEKKLLSSKHFLKE